MSDDEEYEYDYETFYTMTTANYRPMIVETFPDFGSDNENFWNENPRRYPAGIFLCPYSCELSKSHSIFREMYMMPPKMTNKPRLPANSAKSFN